MRSLVRSRKKILTASCLLLALLQPPAANAQAELLVGLGARFAPMIIPIVLSTIPMIPALIREYAPPIPKLGWKKKKATQGADSSNEAEGSVEENAAGAETDKEGTAAGDTSATAKMPEEKAPSPKHVVEDERAVVVRPAPNHADASEWYLDDAPDQRTSTSTADAARSSEDPGLAPAPAKSRRMRVAESVKGEVVTHPAHSEAPASSNQDAPPTQASVKSPAEEPAGAQPAAEQGPSHHTIMMPVSE